MNLSLVFIPLFGISGGEILILFLLVLLLFGPKKIPEIARTLGKGINEIKKVQRDINAEIHRYSDEIENPVKQIKEDIQGFEKGLDGSMDPDKDNKKKPQSPKDPSPGYNEDLYNESANQMRDTTRNSANDDLPYPYNTSQQPAESNNENEQPDKNEEKTEDLTKSDKDDK